MSRKCCADVCITNYLPHTKKKENNTKLETKDVKIRQFGFPKDSI